MYKLKIITSTTRPGRKGDAIAAWVNETAKAYTDFTTEVLNLASINLPLMDEAAHPRLKQYAHTHTKQWSARIDEADAFIIVLAEYNYGFPAPIKNAIDYLHQEWRHKPVAFVSYGGLSGGTRALQLIKPVLTGLSMMPINEAVNIPFYTKYIDTHEVFKGDEALEKSAHTMFTELIRWTASMKGLRVA